MCWGLTCRCWRRELHPILVSPLDLLLGITAGLRSSWMQGGSLGEELGPLAAALSG